MTNRKTKTTRKIGPASTSAILPSPTPSRTCLPRARNRTSKHSQAKPRSRITHHESPAESRLTDHASPSTLHASRPSARTRNGKVARLPFAVRDMINRMLRNNIPHSQIVAALVELNFRVTERNISNWKTRGGYRDWCIAQDRALETRLLQDNLLAQPRTSDASQLAEVGLQLAATQLSQFFLKPETRQRLTAEPEKFARTIGILCRLARQIHILQKYRDQSAKELGDEHNPERSKRDTNETLETIRDIYSAEKPSESPRDPYISHRNFLPKNGYPADPPDHTPEDYSHIDRNIELFEASIAAARAKAQSQTPTPSSNPPNQHLPVDQQSNEFKISPSSSPNFSDVVTTSRQPPPAGVEPAAGPQPG